MHKGIQDHDGYHDLFNLGFLPPFFTLKEQKHILHYAGLEPGPLIS